MERLKPFNRFARMKFMGKGTGGGGGGDGGDVESAAARPPLVGRDSEARLARLNSLSQAS